MDLETLLATCEISGFQFKFSSMITPKKTVSFTWSIFWPSIKSWIFWFVRFWHGLNTINLVFFLTWRNSFLSKDRCLSGFLNLENVAVSIIAERAWDVPNLCALVWQPLTFCRDKQVLVTRQSKYCSVETINAKIKIKRNSFSNINLSDPYKNPRTCSTNIKYKELQIQLVFISRVTRVICRIPANTRVLTFLREIRLSARTKTQTRLFPFV